MTMDLTNFEFYFQRYREKFNKQADALVVFVHWYLVQNKYKCVVESTRQTEILPNQWNSCKEYYDFFYQKGDTRYRMDIYLIDKTMHIQLKRMSDMCDSIQNLNICNYVTDDYANENYQLVFKNLEKLYYRLYKLIKYTKDIPSPSAGSTQTCSSPSSVNSTRTSVIRVESIEGSEETASEDKSDNQDENQTLIENQTLTVENAEIAPETTSTITIVKAVRKVPETKNCSVNLYDCMRSVFKDCKIPIKISSLTDELKAQLKLNKSVQNGAVKSVQQSISHFVLKTNNNRTRNPKRKRSDYVRQSVSSASSLTTRCPNSTISTSTTGEPMERQETVTENATNILNPCSPAATSNIANLLNDSVLTNSTVFNKTRKSFFGSTCKENESPLDEIIAIS